MGQLPKVSQEDINKHFGVSSIFVPVDKVVRRKKKKKRPKKPLLPPIGIDLSKVIFRNHALERFVERMFRLNPGFQTFLSPECLAREILAGSTEKGAIDPVEKVKRCINNGFKDARYFVNGGWRFVVLEKGGRFVVVTTERLRGYDQKPGEIRTMASVMQEDEPHT